MVVCFFCMLQKVENRKRMKYNEWKYCRNHVEYRKKAKRIEKIPHRWMSLGYNESKQSGTRFKLVANTVVEICLIVNDFTF